MSQQPALSGAEGNGPTCSEGDFDLPLSQQPGAMRTPYAPHVAGRNIGPECENARVEESTTLVLSSSITHARIHLRDSVHDVDYNR